MDSFRDSELNMASNIQGTRQSLIENVNKELDKLEKMFSNREPMVDQGNTGQERITKKGSMQKRQFVARNSLMTDLFATYNIGAIYNMFLAILLLLVANTFVQDFFDKGRIDTYFLETIIWHFGRAPIVISIWLGMFLSTVCVFYPVLHSWSWVRGPVSRVGGACALGAYFVYLTTLIFVPTLLIIHFQLPIASGAIVSCELVRMAMKVHAFMRENITRILTWKNCPADETAKMDTTNPCPSMDKFLYFHFIPTLIYKDEYPRTRAINWRFVCVNFLQAFGSVFYVHFAFERFCVPQFSGFSRASVSLRDWALACFGCILPGALVLVLLFWCLLHCWMNAFAEMLRFADRLFYEDWWNSTSFSGYYRMWNLIIHDWCYAYVYKDLSFALGKKYRGVAALSVFLLSSLIHEFVLISTHRFFYPILFVLYSVFGVMFFFISRSVRLGKAWNVAMWFNLMIGNGMIIAFQSMEWFARKNCHPTYSDYRDLIIPRSWSCEKFHLSPNA